MTPRLSPLSRQEIKEAIAAGRLQVSSLAREAGIRHDKLIRWIFTPPTDGVSVGVIDEVGDLQVAIRRMIKRPRKPKSS